MSRSLQKRQVYFDRFADSKDAFFDAYSKAHTKLSELGSKFEPAGGWTPSAVWSVVKCNEVRSLLQTRSLFFVVGVLRWPSIAPPPSCASLWVRSGQIGTGPIFPRCCCFFDKSPTCSSVCIEAVDCHDSSC